MELIIDNNNNTRDDIINFLTLLGTSNGTIIFKASVIIEGTLEFPSNVALFFFNGYKLVFNLAHIKIYGNVLNGRNQIFQLPENHNLTIYNQKVYPEWFSICTHQSPLDINGNPELLYNDNIAIQKAINSLTTNGLVSFFGSNYRINRKIIINKFGIKLEGGGEYRSNDLLDNKKSTLLCTHLNLDCVFEIKSFGAKFTNLNFVGPEPEMVRKGINSKGIGLKFIRENFTKDIDSYVENCHFKAFKICIYGEGANLRITDNLFYSSYTGIKIINAQLNNDLNKAQTRGHIIDRNRFHSMGSYLNHPFLEGATCIEILASDYTYNTSNEYEGFTVNGYYNHITNNYADDCRTFFIGSVDRSIISNNSVLNSGNTAIIILAGVYGVISNNIIDGSFTWNPNKLYPQKESDLNVDKFPDGHGIQISNSNFLTISNNFIYNKRYHGIYVINSSYSSIKMNTIINYNRHRYVKRAGEEPIIQDSRIYCGIFIQKTFNKRNKINFISNNTIFIDHKKVEGSHAIYAGDGDIYNNIKNNDIVPERILSPVIKID